MSELTLDTLEKSFKDNMTKTIKQLGQYLSKNDSDELPDAYRMGIEKYMDEVIESAIRRGGSVDDVIRWVQEVINDINIDNLANDIYHGKKIGTL